MLGPTLIAVVLAAAPELHWGAPSSSVGRKPRAAPVSLTDVPRLHPAAALEKVRERWRVRTPTAVHTFEEDDGTPSPVGERIIQLVDGSRTVQQIADVLLDEFEVDRPTCERDVRLFVGVLVSKKVLVLGGAAPRPSPPGGE
jgi:hypothetical protein